MAYQQQCYTDVRRERQRQDAKWGQQNHSPLEWLAVLTEEVGEVAQEVLTMHFGGDNASPLHRANYREEMVQVAAVAIAAIECLDRLGGA